MTKYEPGQCHAHHVPARDTLADLHNRFSALRACGCTGDPAGFEPPRRDPACRAHADWPDDAGCKNCGSCGEIPAGIAGNGTAYVRDCPKCADGADKARTGPTTEEIAAVKPSRRCSTGVHHDWNTDRYGANSPPHDPSKRANP